MTKPTTIRIGDFLIQVETAAGSGVFWDPCGFSTKSDEESATVGETVVPACPPDEDGVAFVERDVNALSRTLSASGVLNMDQYANWRDWMRSGESRAVRVWSGQTLALNGGYDEGNFVLSKLAKTGNRGSRVEVAIDMMSDGEYAWTDASS